MRPRALVLDEGALSELKRVRDYAEANPLGPRELIRMTQGKDAPVGDNPKHRCRIPNGFQVVFSIEDHGKVTVRHLSVSITSHWMAPYPKDVAMIARELGYAIGDDLEFTSKQLVRASPTWGWSVPNVIEKISG